MIDRYITMFAIFSHMGWIWESIYCTAKDRKWANRGFLYGPLCPIYGFGGTIGLVVYDIVGAGLLPDLSWWVVFLAGFIVSMVLEYPTSLVLEKLFHARWWDYSKLPLNIGGRTSVPTSIAFGGAAILAFKVIIPALDSLVALLPSWMINIFALVFVGIASADLTLTATALTDFGKKVMMATDDVQEHMTELVDRIYKKEGALARHAIKRISVLKFPDDKIKKHFKR